MAQARQSNGQRSILCRGGCLATTSKLHVSLSPQSPRPLPWMYEWEPPRVQPPTQAPTPGTEASQRTAQLGPGRHLSLVPWAALASNTESAFPLQSPKKPNLRGLNHIFNSGEARSSCPLFRLASRGVTMAMTCPFGGVTAPPHPPAPHIHRDNHKRTENDGNNASCWSDTDIAHASVEARGGATRGRTASGIPRTPSPAPNPKKD